MSHHASYYEECLGCGREFGRGKGYLGLARHECDTIAPTLARLARAGVEPAKLAIGFERTIAQIEHLLRCGR